MKKVVMIKVVLLPRLYLPRARRTSMMMANLNLLQRTVRKRRRRILERTKRRRVV